MRYWSGQSGRRGKCARVGDTVTSEYGGTFVASGFTPIVELATHDPCEWRKPKYIGDKPLKRTTTEIAARHERLCAGLQARDADGVISELREVSDYTARLAGKAQELRAAGRVSR